MATYLVAREKGKLVAVAQLNPPSYRKPSNFRYLLHGWLKVYKAGDRRRIDDCPSLKKVIVRSQVLENLYWVPEGCEIIQEA